jgi:hypothetical protein
MLEARSIQQGPGTRSISQWMAQVEDDSDSENEVAKEGTAVLKKGNNNSYPLPSFVGTLPLTE